MCGEFNNDDQEEYVHEDYGNIMAQHDENKTNEEKQEKYVHEDYGNIMARYDG